jgi:glycosyltransferase involved in cell wall biosynthesis
MNLLFFSHSSWLNGAERSLVELIKELTNDYGAKCTVILPSQGPLIELLENEGTETIIAPIQWWCSFEEPLEDRAKNESYYRSLTWLDENLDQLRNIKPDVVLTNTLVIPWGAVAASLLKRPHLWMINEFGELDHNLHFFLPFQQVLEVIDSSSDKIVTRSKAIQNTLFPQLNPNKISTIYRYIDVSGTVVESGMSNKRFFNLPDAFHIIIAGTVSEKKGQEDAVRCLIELVKNRNRKVELVIVGDVKEPDYQQFLQHLIDSENVDDLVHFVPNQSDVLSTINSADIALVCSRMEGLGRVALEAILLKKMVVATNTGGTPEMIADGETGLLYSPGNYVQLADQVERLMGNSDLQIKITQNALNFVGQNFTKERYGGEYYKILMDLTNDEYHPKDSMSSFLNFYFQALQPQKEISIQNLKTQIIERDQFSSMRKSWQLPRPLRRLSQLLLGKKDVKF